METTKVEYIVPKDWKLDPEEPFSAKLFSGAGSDGPLSSCALAGLG